MNRMSDSFSRHVLGCALTLAILAPCTGANAATFKVLYNFQGGASDGGDPKSALVPDGQGGFYGTTQWGGSTGCSGFGCGTIYDITSNGTEFVSHAFTGGSDGRAPEAGLTPQSDGSFLGTTSADGRYSGGTIFVFTPPGSEAVQYSLGKGIRGWESESGLISDRAGNLYGATSLGGAGGYGTIFTLAPDGKYTTLHEFRDTDDGAYPNGPLIRDKMGNLYGTTSAGCGIVFQIAPDGTETTLYAFGNPPDGCAPEDGLVEDGEGNFYGTTTQGGTESDGAIFRVASDGTETILYSFKGPNKNDGDFPVGGLTLDKAGNLYGTTSTGGGTGCEYEYGCGTVFKISPSGKETLLHAFQGSDGNFPIGTLIAYKNKLYGTASEGGTGTCSYNGCGTVFVVSE